MKNLALGIYLVGIYALLGLVYLGDQQTLAVRFLMATIAYSFGRVWWNAVCMEPRWASQIFWLATSFMLLVPGIVQLSNSTFYWPTPGEYGPTETMTAVMILCLGVVLIDLAYLAFPPASNVRRIEEMVSLPAHVRAFHWLGYLGIAWAGGLLLLLGSTFFLHPRGVVEGALVNAFSLPQLGLFFTLGSSLLDVLLVLGARLLVSPLQTFEKQQAKRWMGLLVCCNLLINFPGAQARYPLLATLLMIFFVIAHAANWRSCINAWLAWGFAPLLYGGVRFLGTFNRDAGYDFRGAMQATLDLRGTLQHGDFDGLQITILGVRYVAQQGHTWGQQLLGTVLFFIPRSWWPGKAIPTGSLVAGHELLPYTNLSAPFALESWLDFGWAGLVILSLLVGRLLKKNDAELGLGMMQRQLYIYAFIAFLPILLRGALLAVIGPVVAVFFWLWIANWLARRSIKAGAE